MGLVLAQLKLHISKYGPEELQIVDDNFSHKSGRYIEEFCRGLTDSRIQIRWKCQVRADQLSRDIIDLMANSGCFEIDMGIESGNREVQKRIRKNIDLDKSLEVISWISTSKIRSKAFVMLGFPEESYEQIADTINYTIAMKERGLEDLAIFPVMPFPGTELAMMTGKTVFQGAIIDDVNIYERSFAAHRLRKYSAKPELSLNSRFSPDQLRLLVKFAYLRFEHGAAVRNLQAEFKDFEAREEMELYGI